MVIYFDINIFIILKNLLYNDTFLINTCSSILEYMYTGYLHSVTLL